MMPMPDQPDPNPPKSLHTRPLALERPTVGQQRVTGPLDQTLPWVIEMRVTGTTSTIQVRVRDAMLIGRRSDTTNAPVPEIDLTNYSAFTHGVSRSHALVVIKDNKLMLKDLGSTNGTRLNNIPCEPGKEYRLRHGDELMLGRLKLQVSFAVVPDEAMMNTPIPIPKRKPGDSSAAMPKPATITPTADLPAAAVAAPASSPRYEPAQIPKVGKGERVLIIEGDDDVGEVFEIALRQAGYTVTRVDNVARGLGVIFQQMPDAILIDLLLPDMNGLDLVRYVRKQKTPRRVPMLVVSSATAGFQMGQALEAGADVFLGKPLAVDELVKSVAKAIEAVGT
jgi:CheY-like chemotaxis protein